MNDQFDLGPHCLQYKSPEKSTDDYCFKDKPRITKSSQCKGYYSIAIQMIVLTVIIVHISLN